MKNVTRITSLLLALVMVFGLATAVFADDSYTITISQTTSGYEYEAYQVFKGDLYIKDANTDSEQKVLSNVEWGSGVVTDQTVNGQTLIQAINAMGGNFANCTTAEDVAEVLAENAEFDNATAQAFADVVGQYLSSTKIEDTNYTITVNDPGYYLVKNTTVPDTNEGANTPEGSFTRYILQVVADVTVYHKGNVPSVNKVIVEDNTEKTENEASIGDTVNYKFTGTLPTNIADYDTYFYKFSDTLSKGLTLTDKNPDTTAIENDIKVEIVNGTTSVDVTEYFYIAATEYNSTSGTTITVGIQDLLVLDNDNNTTLEGNQPVVSTINSDTKVVVTYSAVLNENAEVGTVGNKNDVDLEFSNDPNNDGDGTTTPPPTDPGKPAPSTPTGKTPKDEVYTYTTDLTIIKVDENGNRLTGAEFTLTGESVNNVVVTTEKFTASENGTYYKLKDGTYTTTAPTSDDPTTTDKNEDNTAAYESTTQKYTVTTTTEVQVKTETVVVKKTVGDDGVVKFSGLGAGTYTITESATPAGYNTAAPFDVTITWHANGETEGCIWTYTGTDFEDTNNNGQRDENENFLSHVTVVNKPGTVLPETGGMGTTIFYVLGAALVLGAIVLLVTKKRMSRQA